MRLQKTPRKQGCFSRRRRSNYASLVQREVAPQGDGGIVKVRIMQDIKQLDKHPFVNSTTFKNVIQVFMKSPKRGCLTKKALKKEKRQRFTEKVLRCRLLCCII